MSTAPLLMTTLLAAAILIVALPVGLSGVLGAAGRLHRRSRLGLQTLAARDNDDAFALATRVAAPIQLGVLAVGLVCAAIVLLLPVGIAGAIVVAVLGFGGALVLSALAGSMGERAARTVPRPARKPDEGGCCGGCGCGDGGCQSGADTNAAAGADIPDLVADATTAR